MPRELPKEIAKKKEKKKNKDKSPLLKTQIPYDVRYADIELRLLIRSSYALCSHCITKGVNTGAWFPEETPG